MESGTKTTQRHGITDHLLDSSIGSIATPQRVEGHHPVRREAVPEGRRPTTPERRRQPTCVAVDWPKTPPVMQVMHRVHEYCVADIAAALSITVGGTSKLVDRIERAGCCRRTPHPDDARSSILSLTCTGRRLIGQAQRSFEDELDERLGAALSLERLDTLASFLRHVREHIAHQGGSKR